MKHFDASNCPVRSEDGTCMCYGLFCTTVDDEICEAIRLAYKNGYEEGFGDAYNLPNANDESEGNIYGFEG